MEGEIKKGFLKPYHVNGEPKTKTELNAEEYLAFKMAVTLFLLSIIGFIFGVSYAAGVI